MNRLVCFSLFCGQRTPVFSMRFVLTTAHITVQAFSAKCSASDASGCYSRSLHLQADPEGQMHGAQPCESQRLVCTTLLI